MTESIHVNVVAGCVIEKDGKYLLVQEKKPSAYGLWNLPGGRVDHGESFEAAAVREALEETGFHVTVTSKLPVEHNDPKEPVLHAFQAKIISGALNIPKEELLDAQWLTLEEINNLSASNQLRTGWILRSITASMSTKTDL